MALPENCLKFTVLEGSGHVHTNGVRNPNTEKIFPIYFSKNNGESWTEFDIDFNNGDIIYLKADWHENAALNDFSTFVFTGDNKIAVSGDLCSLHLNHPTDEGLHITYLFKNCTNIVDITGLAKLQVDPNMFQQFRYLFEGCTGITELPTPFFEFPWGYDSSTFVTGICGAFGYMFKDCTGITCVPKGFLPNRPTRGYWAPEKQYYDYTTFYQMFQGCSNLKEIHCPFTNWGTNTYGGPATTNWVEGVAPKGKFYCSEDLPIHYGISNIPYGWKVVRLPSGPIPTKLVQMCDYGLGGLF